MLRSMFLAAGVLAAGSMGAAVPGLAATGEGRDDRGPRVSLAGAHGPGGYLGVSLDDVESDQGGALVKEVHEDGPAAKAGLKAGDLIVSFQGEQVRSAAQLARLVRETPSGRKVSLGIQRGGSRQEVQLTMGERRGMGRLLELPPMPPLSGLGEGARAEVFREILRGRPRLGIEFMDLSDQLARFFKVEGGVLVSSVREGSAAAAAGLRAGDVIVKVDGNPVREGRDLHRQVSRVDSEQEVTLGVVREGRPLDIRVKLEARERPRPKSPTT